MRPSALITPPALSLGNWSPARSTLTRVVVRGLSVVEEQIAGVVRVVRSTRFVDSDPNNTNRPSPLMPNPTLGAVPCAPVLETLTRVVVRRVCRSWT